MPTLGVKRAAGEARRDAIVTYVAEHWRSKGWAPSLAEVAEAVGLRSISSVHVHVRILIDRGVLAMDRDKPRSLRVAAVHGREGG